MSLVKYIGISPSGKASDSESDIRRFESYYPSHFCIKFLTFCGDLFFIKIFAKNLKIISQKTIFDYNGKIVKNTRKNKEI